MLSRLTPWLRGAPGGNAGAEPRRFARLFAGLTASSVAFVAGLNWLANPWQLYPTRWLPPRVVNDRERKVQLLRDRRPLPEQLILGSSRVMRFEPRYLEQVTGLATFNAGVPAAAPVDYLVLYRFATEGLRLPVRSVVLGVESPALCNRNRNALAIGANPDLSPFAPAPAGGTAGEGEERTAVARTAPQLPHSASSALPVLFSAAQLRDSWASVRHALRGDGAGDSSPRILEADGFMSWNAHDGARREAKWNLEGRVRQFLKSSYLRPGDLDPQAFAHLDSLLRLLQERRVATLVFLTPSLPAVPDYWRRTGFLPQHQRACEQLRALAGARGARFVDLSTVEAFQGDPDEFYDAVHPTTVNTRRMIKTLFPTRQAAR